MKKMLLLSAAAICAAGVSGCCCCGGSCGECVEEEVIITTPAVNKCKPKCTGHGKTACNDCGCTGKETEKSGKSVSCSSDDCGNEKGGKTACSGNAGNLTASNCSGDKDHAPAPAPAPAAD